MDPRSSTDDHASAAVERRRAFRAFVRAHHPDVGGDPAVFAATVAAYRALERDQPAPGARPTAYRRGGPLAQLSRHWRRRWARRRHRRVH